VGDVDDRAGDKRALADLLAELSSAVDRGDHDRIAACYSDPSYDDHGTFKGSGREFADFMVRDGAMARLHHLLGQSVFTLEGNEAWGETFFSFHGEARGVTLAAWGRYVDYFTRVDGAWKLTYRRVVPDHVLEGDDASSYWQPSRDRRDPSYDRLRWPPGVDAGG
jgi:hypothetical protein